MQPFSIITALYVGERLATVVPVSWCCDSKILLNSRWSELAYFWKVQQLV